MLLISDFIKKMKAEITCSEFCEQVTALIQNVYTEKKADIERLKTHPTERLTASAIIYSRYQNEIWMIGDCQCMTDGVLHTNTKPQEEEIASKRSVFITKALKNGKQTADFQTVDEGRNVILPELISSCSQQNLTFAVIDGFKIPLEKVKILRAGTENVLASDGYPILKNTLQESENLLHQQLHDDPLCIHQFKATKGLMKGNVSFDDRAYIRFTV
jgi:hypothetical protein